MKTENVENERRAMQIITISNIKTFANPPNFQYLCIYQKLFEHENRRNLSILHSAMPLLLFRIYGRA